MKKSIVFAILLLTALWSWSTQAATELNARWSTNQVVLGESFTLQLSTNVQATPELLTIPDFLTAHGRSSSMQIVNGRVASSIQYEFAANRTGEFTIPALDVRIGREQLQTAPWKLKVEAPENLTLPDRNNQNASPVQELVFGRGVFPDDRTRYYVGEEIPVRLQLFIADSVYAQATDFPTLNAGKAIFRQFPDSNNPNYQLSRPRPVTVSDRSYQCLTFTAMFRTLAPGKLQPKASIPVVISTEGRRRNIDYTVDFPLPELVIQPLPPVPAGTLYLGLIGNWQLETAFSGSPRQAGEALTLTVTAAGDGVVSTDTLKAPTLDWPGCRVYPAEVSRSADSTRAEIRYTFIPLEAGTLTLPFQFAAFDPATGHYLKSAEPEAIVIAPGQVKAAAVVEPAPTAAATSTPEAQTHSSKLHYLKLERQPSGHAGVIAAIVFFALFGPAWYGCVLWLRHRRAAATPESIRRRQAKQRKKLVLEKLRCCDSTHFPEVLHRDVLPFLADFYNLPPGLAAGELAAQLPDAELADLLRSYAEHAYAPRTPVDWGPTLEKLWPCLKRLGAVLFLALALALPAAEWQEAVQAYDDGDFVRAQTDFEELWHRHPEDAALWYNLGCVSAQQNHWARAAWYFEGAELLNPGDTAARENLNQVRRKLLQPAYGQITKPQEFVIYLRDLQRPETYLALLAIGWSFLWIWWSYRKHWSVNMLWTVSAAAFLLMLLCAAAWWSQRAGRHASNRAIVRVNRATLYSLPSEHNARELESISGGTPVRILETRPDFYRVQTPETTGWMRHDAVGKLP